MISGFATLPPPKLTLERYLQDRAEEASIPFPELAERAGISGYKLTMILKDPSIATAHELKAIADLLRLNWYEDLMAPFGFGTARITLREAQELANLEGNTIALTPSAA